MTEEPRASTESVVHNSALPGIDMGIVVMGTMDAVDRDAIHHAHTEWTSILTSRFPEFAWRIPLVSRPELIQPTRAEAVPLLQHGIEERDVNGWDFCLVITNSDLIPRYGARAFAAVSRMLDTAVISTARIDPFAFDENVDPGLRTEILGERIETLFRHTFGHLCGLGHSLDPSNPMYEPEAVDDLTPMGLLDDDQIARMAEFLKTVEDERLEERTTKTSVVSFYLRSGWLNRWRILDSVWHARPWTFIRHLGRLTTAAASASIILLITAETWDLALSQNQTGMSFLLLASLLWATFSVLRRQRLLIRREHRSLTEQIVVRNLSTVITIGVAMATTGALIFVATYLLGRGLFHIHLVESWAMSRENGVTLDDYALMATFVAAMSLLVGALGTSFEQEYAVRHLTFVDEET